MDRADPSDEQRLKEKALLLLRRERELNALRAKAEQVTSWLRLAQSLPEIVDRSIPVEEVYGRLRRALLVGLKLQRVALFTMDRSEANDGGDLVLRPVAGTAARGSAEQRLSRDSADPILGARAGFCNSREEPALRRLAEVVGLDRFMWSRISPTETPPVLLVAGFDAAKAVFHAPFDEHDAVHFGNMAQHLEILLGNAVLVNALLSEKLQLKTLNDTLEQRVVERTEALSKALGEIWSEMDLARKVQTVLLPEKTELPDYQIAAVMMPADAVGGDYFDLIRAPAADWLLIGDVSGHGVTAGLGMMMVQTAVRSLVLGGASDAEPLKPSELLTRVNRAVRSNLLALSADQYMTIAALQIRGANITYAGMHETILVYRAATKNVERLDTRGMWLALMEDISGELSDDCFHLEPGDVCLLYTDGLTETVVGKNRLRLGVASLAKHFERMSSETNDVKQILEQITGLVKGCRIHDDITALVVRYVPEATSTAT